MAVSTSSYFSNSIIGTPGLGADIDIYESSTNPKYAVGFGFTRADGNKYRYCHFGALSNRGNIVSTDASESSQTSTVLNVAPTGTNNVLRAGETLRANYAGARYMQLLVTATADQFAGGYITVISGSGTGYTYRIAGNTATSDNVPTTGHIFMDLFDPIQTPLGTDSDITICGSPYANLEPSDGDSALIGTPVGVTVTGNSAASYGWICTHGVIGALTAAPVATPGDWVAVSTSTAGAVIALNQDSATNTTFAFSPMVGYFINPASATAYSQVYLTIE